MVLVTLLKCQFVIMLKESIQTADISFWNETPHLLLCTNLTLQIHVDSYI